MGSTTDTLHELDVVELRHPVEGHKAGTRGTIVSAHNGAFYLVEVSRDGKTVDIVEVERLDVALVQRAADAARLNSK